MEAISSNDDQETEEKDEKLTVVSLYKKYKESITIITKQQRRLNQVHTDEYLSQTESDIFKR